MTTRQLAAKVIELYWPQTAKYFVTPALPSYELRQGGNRDGQDAEIVSEVRDFRRRLSAESSWSLERARRAAPDDWRRLLDFAEWKLIQMPLPKLQTLGSTPDDFLYRIMWDNHVTQRSVSQYQRGFRHGEAPSARGPSAFDDFDNQIYLRPGVGDALVRLYAVLRPIVERKWAQKVADMNRLDETRLESFLFGAERVSLEPVRDRLRALHEGECFYCAQKLGHGDAVHVDHFIPWARHPDNAIENLVPAHERCNLQKKDFLAATQHVQKWRERTECRGAELRALATSVGFEHAHDRVVSVARSIYVRLPSGARLWVRRQEFEVVEPAKLDEAFALPGKVR